MGRVFRGYMAEADGDPLLPLFDVERGAAGFTTVQFANPDFSYQNTPTLLTQGNFSTQKNGLIGIVVDAARLWITGETYAANGAGVYTFGLFYSSLFVLAAGFLPGAAPATPSPLLLDSGWMTFGPSGYNGAMADGIAQTRPPQTLYLAGGPGMNGATLAGNLFVSLAYHME